MAMRARRVYAVDVDTTSNPLEFGRFRRHHFRFSAERAVSARPIRLHATRAPGTSTTSLSTKPSESQGKRGFVDVDSVDAAICTSRSPPRWLPIPRRRNLRLQQNSEAAHRIRVAPGRTQGGTPDGWISHQAVGDCRDGGAIAVFAVVALLAKESERLNKGVIAVIDVFAQARDERKGIRAHKQELQKLQLLLSSSLFSLLPTSIQVAIGTSGAEIFF